MVRSTLLWGGGLGWPKAGNRHICNILWKSADFDAISYIFGVIIRVVVSRDMHQKVERGDMLQIYVLIAIGT